jgi:hypothetical protein
VNETRRLWAPLAVFVAIGLVSAVPAAAATIDSYEAKPGSGSAPRAPSGPPLILNVASEQGASASAPPSGEDALIGNGLESPLCGSPDDLSTSAQQSCETADFVATPDPTGDYAFDVNINTGVSDWGNDVAATTQNLAEAGWMTFVSVTHGLIVMFEWCYSLDLVSGSLLGEVSRALHDSRLGFTEPWLALVLSVASMLAVYRGLVCRRVAETLGQALAMFTMMVGGLWIVADPAGTVGAIEQWANQASLGTLATMASGTPSHPERTLVSGMQTLFGSAVGAPWCYLEFGDVGWCNEPAALDGRLRTTALAIARREQSQSGCRSLCSPGAGAKDRTLAASSALLRSAQTNGELFLALPADESRRNSARTHETLLNVLCGGDGSADECSGSTAAQAEFRTQKGTEWRVIGICLIWSGGLGMLLLFGFIALRLLMAALTTIFLLLLAPALVLAPALGDGGRSTFRAWTMRLLEAVISKLVYSFLLGVVLLMTSALLSITVLGWLAQWLLISAFWWGAFVKRHQTLGLVRGAGRVQPDRSRSMARRVGDTLETPRALLHAGRAIKSKYGSPPPEVEPRPKSASKSPSGFLRGLNGEFPGGRRSVAEGPAAEAGRGRDAGPAPGAMAGASDADEQAGRIAEQKARAVARAAALAARERARRSTVMDDAREVAAGRKSWLGLEPRK